MPHRSIKEGSRQHRRTYDQPQDADAGPAPRLTLHDREHQSARREHEQRRTGKVGEALAVGSARCWGGNSASRSASEVGMRIAPPAAWRMRAPISHPGPGAAAHRAEAPTKVIKPPMNNRLRPSRSARRPAGTSSAAITIAYALRTHERVASLVPEKSCLMLGNAMFTMKRSRLATNAATETITRTR